jgi:hypothetical protein
MVAQSSALTAPASATTAPDPTDREAWALWCRERELDPHEAGLTAFVVRCRVTGAAFADWRGAWQAWRQAPPTTTEPEDELDQIERVSELASVALRELGMPATSQLYGLAEATVARVAAGAANLAMTMIAAGQRAPVIKEAIRAKRKAARAAAPAVVKVEPLREAEARRP